MSFAALLDSKLDDVISMKLDDVLSMHWTSLNDRWRVFALEFNLIDTTDLEIYWYLEMYLRRK
jgi:hypothetical protein